MSEDNSNFQDPHYFQDIEEASTTKSGAKRRASRAGTRSVASLNPEQLARKRANDREAQRSIRQRTKNYLEELEKRIRELSRDEEVQIIEEVRRRNVALEQELRYLREALARAEGSVSSSPDLGASSTRYGMDMLDSPYSYSPQWSSPGRSSLSSSPYTGSSAGDIVTSFAPDYSTLDYGFSEPGSAKSETSSPTSEMSMSMTSTPPQVASALNRRGAPFGSRPQIGRSRSYPHGRIDQAAQQLPPVMAPSRLSMSGNMVVVPPCSGMSQPLGNQSGMGGMMMGMGQSPPTSHPNPNMISIGYSSPAGHPNMAVAMGPPPTTKHYQMPPPSNPLGMEGSMNEKPPNMQRQIQPAMAMNELQPDAARQGPRPGQLPILLGGTMEDGQPAQMQNQWTIFETEEGGEGVEAEKSWRMMR